MGSDPLVLTLEVQRATDRMLATARALDGVEAPSLLPGWTRGHVLTHLARNADSLLNLLDWARTGVENPQYPSREFREAGIQAGAHRPLPEQLADLTEACDRLAKEFEAMPAEAWGAVLHARDGHTDPAVNIVWRRLREVEIHHVDLGAGYTPADWPESFTLRMLKQIAERFGDEGLRVVVRVPELGHDLPIGDGGPTVSGPANAVTAWLLGRSDGGDLTIDPAGPLPAVPPW
jgi:maleylpyruvate isomerase